MENEDNIAPEEVVAQQAADHQVVDAPVRHQSQRQRQRVEYWQAVMEQWRASGLCQAEFCRQRQIQPMRFSQWKLRILGDVSQRQRKVPVQGNVKPKAGRKKKTVRWPFVPISISASDISRSGGSAIILELANGRRLHIPPDIDVEAARKILSIVEAG